MNMVVRLGCGLVHSIYAEGFWWCEQKKKSKHSEVTAAFAWNSVIFLMMLFRVLLGSLAPRLFRVCFTAPQWPSNQSQPLDMQCHESHSPAASGNFMDWSAIGETDGHFNVREDWWLLQSTILRNWWLLAVQCHVSYIMSHRLKTVSLNRVTVMQCSTFLAYIQLSLYVFNSSTNTVLPKMRQKKTIPNHEIPKNLRNSQIPKTTTLCDQLGRKTDE